MRFARALDELAGCTCMPGSLVLLGRVGFDEVRGCLLLLLCCLCCLISLHCTPWISSCHCSFFLPLAGASPLPVYNRVGCWRQLFPFRPLLLFSLTVNSLVLFLHLLGLIPCIAGML